MYSRNNDTQTKKTYPGRLCVIEGSDGPAKSSQMNQLSIWIRSIGLPVFFSEWNLSKLIKGSEKRTKKKNSINPMTYCLMYAWDFTDRYEKVIQPHLSAGYLVLCDQYMNTAIARSIAKGCEPEWIRGIYSFAAKPDIFIEIDAALDFDAQQNKLRTMIQANVECYKPTGVLMNLTGMDQSGDQIIV